MNYTKTSLHPAQYEVLIDQQINVESPHYNIGLYIKLHGKLDKEHFKTAINTSQDLFDIYRMRFDLGDSDPLIYFIDNAEKIEVEELDYSDETDPQIVAKCWMQNQFNKPFFIEDETFLFQHTLIKINAAENWFFFRYHHLINDGYGFNIWLNYIARKYKALVDGEEIRFDYPDYRNAAIRASTFRNSPDYEVNAQYWKNKLAHRTEALLRKNIDPAGEPDKISGNYYLNIKSEVRNRIDEVSRKTKSSLHQLTIAAMLIYYGKTSSQSEMVFGIPVHKRGLGDLRNIVGMFSGVLPFKGVFKEEEILAGLLKSIATCRKGDYAHENYLIIDLIHSLKLKATESFLYDIIINYVPFNFQLNFGEELQSEIQWIQSEFEKIPLQIIWRDYGNNQPLQLGIHYRYEYFTTGEIELLAERIIYILNQFTDALEKAVGGIEIVPPQEQHLLEEFRGSCMPNPNTKTVLDLFEKQVDSMPDAPALVFGDQHLNFKELNERANQLGHYLKSKGIKEEMFVPICLERSIEMIVGILGVLKAGACYVPLDPEYPQERLDFMLGDTNASFILTNKESRSRLPAHSAIEVLELDSSWWKVDNQATNNFPRSVTAANLAYVIYTSGSTGTPKGVMIEHRSLVASTLARQFYYTSFGAVLLIPSFSFDSSVAVIFGTLVTGGNLMICRNEQLKDIEFLRNVLTKVDTILCVPSYYRLLLEEGLIERSSLSKVIVAGENLDNNIIDQHFNRTSNVSLFNEYGPTEYTVWATVDKVEAPDSKVTIGKPIANTSIHIVSKQGYLNPIGEAGEIFIAGDGLARGYLNNEELSKQKFVYRMLNGVDVQLYKTGDLGRWLLNGNIEFLGRVDNQVKIRGYRIELGEIENVLHQFKNIRQSAVLAHQDKEGGKRLIGYIVAEEGKVDSEALNMYLSAKLPHYMIPSVWVELKELPLTANGKIDRNALPHVETSNATTQKYEHPRNEVEINLCTIWQEVFKIKQIGILNNFFALGGDSITSIQVVSRAKKLGYLIEAKHLFLHQTIESLASNINKQKENTILHGEKKEKLHSHQGENNIAQNSGITKSLILAKKGTNKRPVYIVCGGGGTVFTFKNFIELLDENQQVYVLQQPTDKKELAEFPIDIKGIASRYLSEILVTNPNGPYALTGHCIGGIVAFEMAKQMEAMGKKVDLLAMFDTIINEKEKPQQPVLTNSNYIPTKTKNALSKIFLKIHFEAFLLKKHTKHAIKYKIESLKSLINRTLFNKSYKEKNSELIIFEELGDTFNSAYKEYELTPYNKEIIVFYAKDHYYFLDKTKNISFKKYHLDPDVKNRWKSYVKSVKFYEIEGEHSTMFDPKFGGKELASILQKHLNN